MASIIFGILLVFSFYGCSNARPLGFGREGDLKRISLSRKVIYQADEPNIHEAHVVKLENSDSSNKNETFFQGKQDTPEVDRNQYLNYVHRRELESRQGVEDEDVVEARVDSKEGEIPEDVGVMDYAQPQRKPPIHNQP